ncbi:glucoamylase family protein [Kutzneria chonburiensis]|uniref:Glucoamylase family protein n=1 Tax=Kutzneria chonburiensis TaxID=1483604 RepID=A0ABV6MM27_9PSEU|nr:glucoamylase family protein [Kutzneria chonburiensis]
MNRLHRLIVAAVALTGACAATAAPQVNDSWQTVAADDTVITNPTPHLTDSQLGFLREVGQRTWRLLSGPGVDPATSLPLASVLLAGRPAGTVELAPATADQQYTNPALIGNYLTAIAAAKDLGLDDHAQDKAAAVLARIQKLAKYNGFLFRWYSTTTGQAIEAPRGRPIKNGYVSTVDNAWLAQGMVTAGQAFPALTAGFQALLDAMQWDFLYNAGGNVLYNGFQVGGTYSDSTYDNMYSGPRIADYIAIGSGKVPGHLWWGLARTPPADHRQRQVPAGQNRTYSDPQDGQPYTIFEGHYVYDRIKFVPTFGGSMYQALAPAMVVPEQALAPQSLGMNNRNTALAQGAYGQYGAKTTVFGWSAATSPTGNQRYTNYGATELAINQGAVPDDVITPSAAFLAVPIIPEQAFDNISQLITRYPMIYNQYGLLDAVEAATGTLAPRFMAISQTAIMMAVDNAVNQDRLQGYFAAGPYAKLLFPYLSMERYSIHGLVGPG